MRVSKVSLSYSEKRSARFQTCDAGMSIEVELAEGETVKDAVEKYQGRLRDEVTAFTVEEVIRLAEEAHVMTNGGQQR